MNQQNIERLIDREVERVTNAIVGDGRDCRLWSLSFKRQRKVTPRGNETTSGNIGRAKSTSSSGSNTAVSVPSAPLHVTPVTGRES